MTLTFFNSTNAKCGEASFSVSTYAEMLLLLRFCCCRRRCCCYCFFPCQMAFVGLLSLAAFFMILVAITN